MEAIEIEGLIQELLAGKFTFETDEYAKAINNLTSLHQLDNSLDYLKQLAESNDYTHIFALSFILEHYPPKHLAANRDLLSVIILKAISKDYFRANYYFLYPLTELMRNDEEYFCFLNLLKSERFTLQNTALQHLYYFDDNKYKNLSRLESTLCFSLFYDLPDLINKHWFARITKNKCLLYKKILLTAVYNKIQDKKLVYSLTDMTDAELFDFVYIWLPIPD